MQCVIITRYIYSNKRKIIKEVKFVSEDEFNTFFNDIIVDLVDLHLLMVKKQKYEIYRNDDFTIQVGKCYCPADHLIKLYVDFVI